MPISYPDILDIKSEEKSAAWTDRDSMLYALGIGMGADPLDEAQLRFVYEKDLRAVPTQAIVLALPAEKLVELHNSGALEKIYNHLSSLVGWDRLIAIASAKQARTGPIAANIQ